MKPSKAALELKSVDRSQLRELFRTAHQTDMDRGQLREYIERQGKRNYKNTISGTLGELVAKVEFCAVSILSTGLTMVLSGGCANYSNRFSQSDANQTTIITVPQNSTVDNFVSFPIWKTIEIGTGLKTASDFRKALIEGGYRIDDWANNEILNQPDFTVATKPTEVELINVSPRELGFNVNTNYKDIYVKARSMGLNLCPAEVGPQLRLQYKNQPMEERIMVAMEPVIDMHLDSDGIIRFFYVGHDEIGQWLHGWGVYPDDVWSPDYRFVFVRQK